MKQIGHEYTQYITCPYCGWTDGNSEESGVEEDKSEYECGDCEKVFYARRIISIDYVTSKIEK